MFSKEELLRYNRHVIMPDFGMAAQEKLKNARVLVVGAGGLGSPLLLYLAAAGVGHIGIIDADIVEDSNLHRQVLFGVEELGTAKVEAAKKRLLSLNPYIEIEVYQILFTSANALEIAHDYDVIADGTDNFPTRYLVNDVSVLLDKPNVYASIYQFEGHVSVFNYVNAAGERGPNYRDLYPNPPEAGAVPNCAEAGVLGVLPGIIGSLQALEVIKVITGVGEPLSGRFYTFDALSFESRTFKLKRDPANPLNGENPSINELIDYEHFCGIRKQAAPLKEISAAEFQDWQDEGVEMEIIDVREPHEFELVNIGGTLIPLAEISDKGDKVARDKKVVLICKSGVRSVRAIEILQEKYGFNNLYNLKGGLINLILEADLDLPTY
ncbi:MAG: molybdopterin-synthase adenylyltransferase MoeB [Arcticibacter sp.]